MKMEGKIKNKSGAHILYIKTLCYAVANTKRLISIPLSIIGEGCPLFYSSLTFRMVRKKKKKLKYMLI